MAQKCLLFNKLPAELRNEIYELSFTTNGNDEQIKLQNATPPSKALLLTCRKAYQEAREYYRPAYRSYWCDGNFHLDFTSYIISQFTLLSTRLSLATGLPIAATNPDGVEHISRLTIFASFVALPWHIAPRLYELLHRNGLWKVTFPEVAPSESYYVWAGRKEGRHLHLRRTKAYAEVDMAIGLAKMTSRPPMWLQLENLLTS